jgi:Ca2+-binding RTX toxin-like protein
MATITGKAKKSFIHAEGDGLVAPDGYKDVTGVTDDGDTIIGQARNDIIYAGDGENEITGGLGTDEIHGGLLRDIIHINSNAESSGLSEIIDGGGADDALFIETEGGVLDLSGANIISIEKLFLLPNGPIGEEPLSVFMTDDQVSAFTLIFSQVGSASINLVGPSNLTAVDVSIHTFLTLNGSDEDDTISWSDGGIGAGFVVNLGGGDDVLDVSPNRYSGDARITLSGGDGNDRISSKFGLNTLYGDAGDDLLSGGSKQDTLDGGTGADRLNGGGKGDILTGGDDADVFVYGKLKDSAPGGQKHDVITDFSHAEGDLIDLSMIDADSTSGGNQAFHLGADIFSHVAGELIQIVQGGGILLRGDVDGNGAADFEILLSGETPLVASDFIF